MEADEDISSGLQEDIAVLNQTEDANLDVDELESFRLKWKFEVAEKHKRRRNPSLKADLHPNTEEARRYFQQGIESERKGEMNRAIRSYRMAVQLDPEIEQHMSDFTPNISDDESLSGNETADSDTLLEKFNHINLSECEPCDANNVLIAETNITHLPSEILCWIFRWVASSEMDMKSIESLSETCRKFYVLARDQALWKVACERIWGLQTKRKEYSSWRNMFIERPHVLLDGVYISKVSYFRQGDPTVFSIYYEPFQCVEYYRYIRFFGNGKMILYTTPDEPSVVIPKLEFENAAQLQFRVGHYKSHSEQQKKFKTANITGILVDAKDKAGTYRSHKRAKRSEKKYILMDSEYFLELELTSTSIRKKFNKLSWVSYSCRYKYVDRSHSNVTEFSLRDQYPPFYFSKVKSYNNYSQEPL